MKEPIYVETRCYPDKDAIEALVRSAEARSDLESGWSADVLNILREARWIIVNSRADGFAAITTEYDERCAEFLRVMADVPGFM